jgi:hypothetical protein
MRAAEAAKWHFALALILRDVWTGNPRIHQSIHNYLGDWRTNEAPGFPEFIQDFAALLKTRGATSNLLAAVERAPDTPVTYQPIHELFENIVELVASEYESIGLWTPSGHVQLTVVPHANALYPDTPSFCDLGASAVVEPLPGGEPAGIPSSVVKLKICPTHFGPPSLAALPYILCHELVAHINQKAPMRSNDPFGEGWMDEVAFEFFQRRVEVLAPQYAIFALNAARDLRSTVRKRYSGLSHASDDSRAFRSVGTYAAEEVRKQLSALRSVSAAGSPDASFERLSYELNTLSSSVEQREAFISAVLRSLVSDDLRLAVAWSQTLTRWMEGRVDASTVLSFS